MGMLDDAWNHTYKCQRVFFWIELARISNSTNIMYTLKNYLIHVHLIEVELHPTLDGRRETWDYYVFIEFGLKLGSGMEETIVRYMQTVKQRVR